MQIGQWRDLLTMLKAVADENRLKMIGFMSHKEHTVTEMAGLLDLSEPTVSHHVSKLHSVGFLRLRMAGTQRFYRINEDRLVKFKAYVNAIDSLIVVPEEDSADNTWIEALNWDEADKRVLRTYTQNKKLTQIPMKDKKMLVILRWLATFFQPDVRYTEKEINAIITTVHEDYATLRRNLVEYGFMRRERGGGDYWLTPEDT